MILAVLRWIIKHEKTRRAGAATRLFIRMRHIFTKGVLKITKLLSLSRKKIEFTFLKWKNKYSFSCERCKLRTLTYWRSHFKKSGTLTRFSIMTSAILFFVFFGEGVDQLRIYLCFVSCVKVFQGLHSVRKKNKQVNSAERGFLSC